MRTEQWFEKATAYFNGTMTAEESRLFEKETAENEELSQLMQFWKDTDAEAAVYEQYKEGAAALIATHQKLKAEFIKEHADELSTGTNKRLAGKSTFSVWKWIAVAAAITGIIFVLKIFAPSSQNNTRVAQHKTNSDSEKTIVAKDSPIDLTDENKNKEKTPALIKRDSIQPAILYAQAFAPDNAPENPNGPLDDAFFYYESGQYKNAIKAIDSAGSKALTRGSNAFTPLTNFYAGYYKALSMMSLGNVTRAIPLLKQSVRISPSEILKAKAQWYLALAYLKQDKILPASNTLQSLIRNPSAGQYKSKAEKLLLALKK